MIFTIAWILSLSLRSEGDIKTTNLAAIGNRVYTNKGGKFVDTKSITDMLLILRKFLLQHV